MSDAFYITTPIYYVNARPHLGHAYTTIIADVAARFNTMKENDVFFLTGTDEHGDKIIRAAEAEGKSPKEYVDHISSLYRALWPQLHINNDRFIRTTDPDHIAIVEQVLQKIYDAGDIYFSEYEGLYCYGCERFYTEKELVDGKCPDHDAPPEVIKESNYFFKMSKYQGALIDHIRKNPDFIRPERYRNEVLSFLKEPLEDLCISRPKSRINWGITLPFDENYVTYVWFDALINYISALGYPDGELYKKYWPSVQHIVAKDILKPHGIYWPTMMMAAGIPLYRHLNVHGYWNINQSKMSKTIGNVVEPLQMKDKYGCDAFRFFLLREMAFGLDAGFSEEALVQRINSDLANDIGNLFSRVLAMTRKYFDGIVPEIDLNMENEFNLDLAQQAQEAIDEYERQMDNFAFHKAIAAVWGFISQMNKCVDTTAPWELAKNESSRKQLAYVMYNLLEGLRVVSGLVYPAMPQTAKTMQKHLGLDPEAEFYRLGTLKAWNILPAGTSLPKAVTLFPRIDPEKVLPKQETVTPGKADISEIKPEIGIEDFLKVDLRVATITKAEAVPKAKKLLKLEVDLGEKRTIVAGISASYKPDDLIGKQVVIVANLKPAKLMGILSNGMLLAAADRKSHVVATLDSKVPSGTPLS
ncbi:MAG: methionine--tRNA ligase [Desulfobacterales bacterium]|nr:methionine--tRNA ligase [Desulfobacterales bacterium]